MRTTFSLLGVLLVAGIGAVLVRGQPAVLADAGKPARTITVTGTGTADARPDSARVYLGVTSFAPTVVEARTANRAAVQKVQAAVAALNLADPKTRTTDTRVAPRHATDNRNRLLGYEVTQAFTVRVADADPDKLAQRAEQILDAGLGNGANADGRVEFFVADDTDLRRRAMKRAVEDALASAAAYAAGGKVAVAEVTSMEEPQHWYGGERVVSNNFSQAVAPGAEAGTLAAGNWTVTSTVRVVCRY